jgi:hypothetical protein
MSDFDRNEYTSTLLDQLTSTTTKHDIYRHLWMNYHNKDSLRLTKKGFVILSKELNLQYYTASLKHKGQPVFEGNLHGSILLQIDRALTCPYYLYTEGKLELFGEKERAWLALVDDELFRFLESWK